MWYDNRGSPVPETLEVATELMFKIKECTVKQTINTDAKS